METFFTSGRYYVDQDSFIQRGDAPRMGWTDFLSHFGKLENPRILFGTAYSWFALISPTVLVNALDTISITFVPSTPFSTPPSCNRFRRLFGAPSKAEVGKSFTSLPCLRTHESNIHNPSRPHKCDQCCLGFEIAKSLNGHSHVRGGVNSTALQYTCDGYRQNFSDGDTIRNHQNDPLLHPSCADDVILVIESVVGTPVLGVEEFPQAIWPTPKLPSSGFMPDYGNVSSSSWIIQCWGKRNAMLEQEVEDRRPLCSW